MGADKRKMTVQAWLILIGGGISVSLVFAVVIAVAAFIFGPGDSHTSSPLSPTPSPPVSQSSPPVKGSSSSDDRQQEPPSIPSPPALPPDSIPEIEHWATYENIKSKVPPGLRDLFIGFSFRYPANRCVLMPTQNNFVLMEKNYMVPGKGKMTQETMSIIPLNDHDIKACLKDATIEPAVLRNISKQVSVGYFPNLREKEIKTGSFKGINMRELLFDASVSDTAIGPVRFYGRIFMLIRKGKGLCFVVIGSSLMPAIQSAEDAGVKGDLGELLKSFEFTED